MKILYVLQQSIYNNRDQWLSADSNINMMVGMLREMEAQRPDWHFYVLIADVRKFGDIKSFKEIYDGKNVTWIEYPFPVNAFTNRFNFNERQFGAVLDTVKPDIVWNNICELTRNMKTVARHKKLNPKFITANYWMDCPFIGEGKVDEDISYFWRQFDGFLCSDLSVFTCESTKQAFFQNARIAIQPRFLTEIENKSAIFDFGYSSKEVWSREPNVAPPKIPIIGFLNRLSGINYTHHIEFIDACKAVDDLDFGVWFSNPSMKVDPEFLRKSVPGKEVITLDSTPTREEYLDMLHQMRISVHLYTIERYGGCAVREAIEAKNIIVAPRVFEYARILGSDYPFYVKNDLSDLPEVLRRAIQFVYKNDLDKSRALSDDILKRNRESSFEIVAKKVITVIEKFVMHQ